MADVSVTPPLRNVIEGIIAADRVSRRSLPAVDVADAILAIPEIAAGLAALRMIGAWLPVETERNHDGTITVWAGKHCADAVSLTSAVLALADAIEEAE